MRRHIHNSHSIQVAAPVATAFMFFTPAGEERWVDGWKPHYIQPTDGATRHGMVFTTGTADEFTIWQLVDFDKTTWRSRYVRTTPALRTGIVEVRCTPLDGNHTQVSVSYDITALNAAGEASLAAYEGDAFVGMIEGWAVAIAARLGELVGSEIP